VVRMFIMVLIVFFSLLCSRYQTADIGRTNYEYYRILLQKNKDVQEKLRSKGYYKGKIDGVLGGWTSDVIRKLQKDRGIEETGMLDPKTEQALND